ncbi:MAG TPA: hypothetical protein DEG17_24410 [Cyanobacteria bacterium UBA11149]|nr:hypothetical protein [Cyanobacteria bacterium UBA11367]HBE55975.1 hypothetical protein [Cyanobacteria bacterium UBA11366]HBK63203.1 hypothetical protein [Cyanobacteria bacterium UBA11166]HBR74561.1 hypothetical protein [Cyanobacteria bacterium UBA11159]HBS67906.1 hypothetical protein [Cyanobacteria bacterium UBA11153]HBW91922.1 hypothetical protein [Cyanobacteria bacterium UBA11149]HCA94740.1 hypothetical protein [Cyanobacteria bacterium UBA9226]
MNNEEALGIVETTLREQHLSKLQVMVFRQAWEEQSYYAIAKTSGYEVGYVKQTGSQLWQLLSQAFGEKVTKSNLQLVLKRKAKELDRKSSVVKISHNSSPIKHYPVQIDWGDAPDIAPFYGRNEELSTLKKWILQDGCRLVGLFGMGGIGKTSLSVKLAREIQGEFDYVIWRSLHRAPPFEEFLEELIQSLTISQDIKLSHNFNHLILQLLTCLRMHRCLVVLDNIETILAPCDRSGGYLPGYEGYGQLLKCLGETNHQSTILLTSREKLQEIALIEGKFNPIRSMVLTGLSEKAIQDILRIKGDFFASTEEWAVLVERYGGNPFTLKIVAGTIQYLFNSSIPNFLESLEEDTSVFGDIRYLLASQMERLSDLESEIVYWLSIAQKPVTFSELRTDFVPQVSLADFLEALTSLERRSLLEKVTSTIKKKTQTLFTLKPLLMDYISNRLQEEFLQKLYS